jgi:hypothetical protein
MVYSGSCNIPPGERRALAHGFRLAGPDKIRPNRKASGTPGHLRDGTTLDYKSKGLIGVDFKSTIINNGFAFLFLDMLLNNLIGNISRAYSQVATSPEMFSLELFLEMGKFHEQDSGAYSFEPLHDLMSCIGR